jgi:hypothetical protein
MNSLQIKLRLLSVVGNFVLLGALLLGNGALSDANDDGSGSLSFSEKFKSGGTGYKGYHFRYPDLITKNGGKYIGLNSAWHLKQDSLLSSCNLIVISTGLPNEIGLPDEACRHLSEYVKNGGILILEHTALKNFTGEFPIKYGAWLKDPKYLQVTDNSHIISKNFTENQKFDYKGSYSTCEVSGNGKVLMTDSENRPVLAVAGYGKGVVIYSGLCLGHFSSANLKLKDSLLTSVLNYVSKMSSIEKAE